MLLGIGSDTDAEMTAILPLEGTYGHNQLVRMGVAGRIGRKALLAGERVAPQRHHVLDAHELEILQQCFRFVGRCSGTDQVRHYFHRIAALDGRADRYGADAVADDAAAVAAVGLRFETDLVAVRGHVDVTRREFHQRGDAFQQLVLADAAHRRHDFERGEGSCAAPEHVDDSHSRWDR